MYIDISNYKDLIDVIGILATIVLTFFIWIASRRSAKAVEKSNELSKFLFEREDMEFRAIQRHMLLQIRIESIKLMEILNLIKSNPNENSIELSRIEVKSFNTEIAIKYLRDIDFEIIEIFHEYELFVYKYFFVWREQDLNPSIFGSLRIIIPPGNISVLMLMKRK